MGNICRNYSFTWLNGSEKRPQLIKLQRLQAKDRTDPQRTSLKRWTACTLRSSFSGHLLWAACDLCSRHQLLERLYPAQLIASLVHIFSLT